MATLALGGVPRAPAASYELVNEYPSQLHPITLEFDIGEEDVGIIGGEMKCINTNRTDDGEGKPLCTYS